MQLANAYNKTVSQQQTTQAGNRSDTIGGSQSVYMHGTKLIAALWHLALLMHGLLNDNIVQRLRH